MPKIFVLDIAFPDIQIQVHVTGWQVAVSCNKDWSVERAGEEGGGGQRLVGGSAPTLPCNVFGLLSVFSPRLHESDAPLERVTLSLCVSRWHHFFIVSHRAHELRLATYIVTSEEYNGPESSNPGNGKTFFFSSPKRPERLRTPTPPSGRWLLDLFHGGKAVRA